AAAALISASEGFPGVQGLLLKHAELLQYSGDLEGAYRTIAPALARADAEPMIHVLAARLSTRLDPPRAVYHGRLGAERLTRNRVALSTLCEAYLAVGDLDAAGAIALGLHESATFDQYALGLLSLVWRLTGDVRYLALHDYDRLVRSWTIDTPEGWSDLETYLADLTRSLSTLHTLFTHPVGQSVRHGSQTSQSLTHSSDPVIQAFFRAVDGPIRRHIQALGDGSDLVRSRRSDGYAFNGVWSVRLRPNGFHADHLHPMGWLSSACYIALPAAVDSGREGWLKFGEPGIPTVPALDPEYFVKPEPGMLVLFPSYMWHGTVPFSGEEPRLTIAFDVVPAAKPLEGDDGRFTLNSRSRARADRGGGSV
ncbi:MAG: 2OG-Fe(II) oxygenase family protein, partial [Caulobacteraceae bacterium]